MERAVADTATRRRCGGLWRAVASGRRMVAFEVKLFLAFSQQCDIM